ncbi:methylated-DNA--[protein]-cysteine S-methyltransferase [Methyloversatilis thermotolerans]|uniref:methylated-DNA--[protein]-cysteine S-methyltransferase n=1 Tax=Methyloversatilis thermotolerans TaxID=1346290 RepID=UPI00037E4C45|nr:methylated-DNA--[protein]-cysteine S-methyltransferase [Methyloversatilis thermotolerans]
MRAEDDCAAVVAAPGFALGLVIAGNMLGRIDFLPAGAARRGEHPVAQRAFDQLQAYLADATCGFELPLALAGSPHQLAVWQAMRDIPCGETTSYGEIARRVGSSARAVGAACGANPLPVLIPCHRVIAAGGRLGGFAHARDGFLIDIKRWLLAHEARAKGFMGDARALS